MCFNNIMSQSKAHFGRQRMHDVFHTFCALFFYHTTAVTNEHRGTVGWLIEQMAKDIAVGGFHLMHKPLFQQKIERTIHGWRLGLRLSFPQQVEQVIGADSPFLQAHQAQHFETLWRKPHVALRTEFFSLSQ